MLKPVQKGSFDWAWEKHVVTNGGNEVVIMICYDVTIRLQW